MADEGKNAGGGGEYPWNSYRQGNYTPCDDLDD